MLTGVTEIQKIRIKSIILMIRYSYTIKHRTIRCLHLSVNGIIYNRKYVSGLYSCVHRWLILCYPQWCDFSWDCGQLLVKLEQRIRISVLEKNFKCHLGSWHSTIVSRYIFLVCHNFRYSDYSWILLHMWSIVWEMKLLELI